MIRHEWFERRNKSRKYIRIGSMSDMAIYCHLRNRRITGVGLKLLLPIFMALRIKLLAEPDAHIVKWSDLIEQKQELWPIQLLPGGAYIH
jgi:hypothetical protein